MQGPSVGCRLACRYQLTSFQSGLVVSLSLFGALAGSAAAFVVGDPLGRKRELLLASGLYGAPCQHRNFSFDTHCLNENSSLDLLLSLAQTQSKCFAISNGLRKARKSFSPSYVYVISLITTCSCRQIHLPFYCRCCCCCNIHCRRTEYAPSWSLTLWFGHW